MRVSFVFAMVLAAALSRSAARAGDAATQRPVLKPLPELLLKQHADNGERLERSGDFSGALKEYQAAIAEQPVNDRKPIAPLADDPHPFLNRASAELDAARVMRMIPGHDPKEMATLLSRANAHFSAVLTIVEGRSVSPANETVSLSQKASLGRAYVGLLSGNVTKARADLENASTRPGPAVPQLRGLLTGIDERIAALPPPQRDKQDALVKLGVEVIKAFLPKYVGLATAVGNVADAFRK